MRTDVRMEYLFYDTICNNIDTYKIWRKQNAFRNVQYMH